MYVTLQSATCFEHQHAHLQEDKSYYHSICYRHSLNGCTVCRMRADCRAEQSALILHTVQRESRGIVLLLHDLGTRWGWVVNATPRQLYPRKRHGTRCIRGWVGPRTGLICCGKYRPHRDSIPGPCSP
jgi:hypothetical protein